jgi:ER-bound oxygenase mpaB/B'/Rubber oxygenase, catalytic domain
VVRTPDTADCAGPSANSSTAAPRSATVPTPRPTNRRVTTRRVYAITQPEIDPAVRNQLINVTYHDMAADLATILGTRDANWCTFAMWPSFTVGAQFRTPGLATARRAARSVGRMASTATPERVCQCVRWASRPISTRLGRLFLRFRGAGSRVLGRSLAFANRGVFYEVGTALADFVETFPRPPGPRPRARAAFRRLTQRVSQMPDPPGEQWVPVDKEILCKGLRAYFDAMLETDPARKSQLVLDGTLRITDYEQQRLQTWLRLSLLSPLITLRFWLRRFRGGPRTRIRPIQGSVKRLDRLIARLVTRFLVVLSTPGETIPVGRDLRAPRGKAFFPPELQSPSVPALRDLLDSYEGRRRAGRRVGGENTAVRDWTDHRARMLFVATYFRSRAKESALWTAPYSPERMDDIAAYPLQPAAPRPHRSRLRPPGFSDRELDRRRAEGDAVAAAVISLAVATAPIRDTTNDLRQLMQIVLQQPVAQAYVNRSAVVPSWVDEAIIDRAQRLYADWQFQFAMGLLFASLPDCYAAANGVRVLNLVSDLANDPVRRVLETAQLVKEVMTRPFWKDREAAMDLRRLRLLHALVRHAVQDGWAGISTGQDIERPNARVWDMRWGLPVNQEDLAGTLFEFAVTPLRFLDEVGVAVDRQDKDAYVHAWCAAGFLLGVDEALLLDENLTALDYRGAARRLDVIRDRQRRPSWEGQRMTAALLDDLEWRAPLFASLPRAMLRIGVGDALADMLGVPRRGLLEPVIDRLHGFLKAHRRRWAVRTFYRHTARWVGRRLSTSIDQDRRAIFRQQLVASAEGVGQRGQSQGHRLLAG